MKLNLYGSEALGWESYPDVENFDYAFWVAVQLEEILRRYGFRGITAPQVGIMTNLAVVKLRSGFETFVNPVITRMYGTEIYCRETCISCPPKGNGCKVARMTKIDVEYLRLVKDSGCVSVEHEMRTFVGQESGFVHHEIDHLAGTFFFDRASLYDKPHVLDAFDKWKYKWRRNGHHPIYGEVRK